MNWSPDQCRPGDMIRVNLGVFHHYGIFVSEEQVVQFGLPPIPENRMPQDEIAVLTTDIDTFACGRIVEVARFDKEEAAAKFPPEEIVSRALSRLGEKGYNLIHNNCEHFANDCVFGLKRCSVEEEARRRWNNRPILDVYFSPVDRTVPVGTVYPPERASETEACADPRLRQDKYRSWLTLCFALKNSLSLDPETLAFEKTKRGKWLCDKAFFSIAHSGGWIAVAVSNRDVGIDLERISAPDEENNNAGEPARRGVFKRRGAKPDAGAAPEQLAELTRKQAAYKRDGRGKFSPGRIPADPPQTMTRRFDAPVGAIASVSGANIRNVRFHILQNDTVTMITPLSEL